MYGLILLSWNVHVVLCTGPHIVVYPGELPIHTFVPGPSPPDSERCSCLVIKYKVTVRGIGGKKLSVTCSEIDKTISVYDFNV